MPTGAYLDWNATAPLRPQARDAMVQALDIVGNPSSIHAPGRSARRLIETAREQVAMLVNAAPRDVVFTSGGTEANMLALAPSLGDSLLVSAIEHPSVKSGGRFGGAVEILVTGAGVVDLVALQRLLSDSARPLVSLMLANNETGAVQPVAEAAALVHTAGGLLHVDAVQGPGRIACDFAALGADLVTLSSHKIGGPQGVGALIRRDGLSLEPLIKGGGQERGARAGTENVAGIAGFGAAADATRQSWLNEASRSLALRDEFERRIKSISPNAVVFSEAVQRLPNTTLFAMPGIKAETAVIAFDLEGVAVSSGAACSSGKVTPSHILAAMGIEPQLARGAIRVSLGYSTTDRDIEIVLKAWEKLAKSLYRPGNHPEIAA